MRERKSARVWIGSVASAAAVSTLLIVNWAAPMNDTAQETTATAQRFEIGSGESGQGPQRYVAIGDSYASTHHLGGLATGEGECPRGRANYPTKVAEALEVKDFDDVSCGGASTRDITQPQLRPRFRSLSDPQAGALRPDTSLVTVGIGVNDFALFSRLLRGCVEINQAAEPGAVHPCRTRWTQATDTGSTDVLRSRAAAVENRLTKALWEIKQRVPGAAILVLGYPRVVPKVGPGTGGTCTALPMTRGDYRYVSQVWGRLNLSIERAARRTDTYFVDAEAASVDRHACTEKPWVSGVEAVGEGTPFHPTTYGVIGMQRLVTSAFRAFQALS